LPLLDALRAHVRHLDPYDEDTTARHAVRVIFLEDFSARISGRFFLIRPRDAKNFASAFFDYPLRF
jgi:hypothetical protein